MGIYDQIILLNAFIHVNIVRPCFQDTNKEQWNQRHAIDSGAASQATLGGRGGDRQGWHYGY